MIRGVRTPEQLAAGGALLRRCACSPAHLRRQSGSKRDRSQTRSPALDTRW